MELPSASPPAGAPVPTPAGPTASAPVGEPTPPPPGGATSMRVSGWSLVRAGAIVAAGLLVLRAVVAAETVIWWLAIATVVAAVLHPAVTLLRRWLPAWVAILVVVVGGLGFVGFVGYQGAAELAVQYETLQETAVEGARELEGSDQFGEFALEFRLLEKTTTFFEDLPVVLAGGGGESGAAAAVQSAASSGSALFAIATFAVLLLIFGVRFVQGGLDQIDDPTARRRIGALVIDAYHASCLYVWLMTARAVVIGVVGGLVCGALGMETPTALGVGFAVLSIIPGLGIVLAVIPVAGFVAITSPATAVILLVAAAAVQAAEAMTVQRWIHHTAVQVGPTATLVASLFGLQLYGVGGMLVALAVALYAFAVLRNLTDRHDEVLTAMRRLVRDDSPGGEGTTVVAEAGSRVVLAPGTEMEVDEPGDGLTGLVIERDPDAGGATGGSGPAGVGPPAP